MDTFKKRGGNVCSAKNCKNKKYNSKVSFFRFPKDVERARIWAIASHREDLLDKVDHLHESHRLCGAHFLSKMFLNNLQNRLHATAMPTIFSSLEDFSGNIDHTYSALPTTIAEISTEYAKKKYVQRPHSVKNLISKIIAGYGALVLHRSQNTEYGASWPWRILFRMTKEKEDISLEQETEIDDTRNIDTSEEIPSKIRIPENHAIVPDQTTWILSPLDENVPVLSIDKSAKCSDILSPSSSTQTCPYLSSSHSPSKETFRRAIQYLQRENDNLKKKNEELHCKLENLDHITLEQYKFLTFKFCPSKLANLVNDQLS